MKILMVNPNVVVGGAQKIMLYLAKGLEERGHTVFIYTTSLDLAHLPPFARRLTYFVEPVPILREGGELANYTAIENVGLLAVRLFKLRRALRRVIAQHRIDLVNPHNPPANWLCSFLPLPVVWSCHNNPMAFYRNLRAGYSPLWPTKNRPHHRLLEGGYEGLDYVLIRHGIDAIVSLSDKIARRIQQIYGRRSEVITFALSGEDGIRPQEGSADQKFERMERDGLTLVQVGQLAEDKKPRIALEVLEAVRGRIPKVRLWFVGDGTLRSALEEEVKRRRLEEVVSFLGFKNEHELAEIYTAAHILLFPGAHQPLGIAPIEAIWKSVVPIVSESSGVAEILKRHGLSTVVPSTADSFAQQVLALYERRTELGAWLGHIRQSLETELDYNTFLDRYERLFERCINNGGRARRPARHK